jgi:hypothetical protein
MSFCCSMIRELKASTVAPVVEADHGRIDTRMAMMTTEIDCSKTAPMAGPEGHRQSGSKA